LKSQLAAGRRVITFTPEPGKLMVAEPKRFLKNEAIKSDILVVVRIRRSTSYPNYLMLLQDTIYNFMEQVTALRLDPSEDALLQLHLTTEKL
jgi:hypothetical protein